MKRSNERYGHDTESQQQQPTRRRSLINRVWQAVIRLLCIRGNNGATHAADNNRQSANVDEIPENNTSTQPEVTSTPNQLVIGKQTTSIISSSSCITNIKSIHSYSLEVSLELKKADKKGKITSSSSFVAATSTSVSSPSPPTTPLPSSSSSSSSSNSSLSSSTSNKSFCYSSSYSPGQIIFIPVVGRSVSSLLSLSPGEVILPMVNINCSPSPLSSSSSSSSSNFSRPDQTTTALPVGKLDATSQHLNLILPPIRLLDSSSVSPLGSPVELGSGSFGRVDLMASNILGLVAVKTASMKNYKDPEDAWNQMCLEARVMKFLSGLPSFPEVYGVVREGNECRMVQEFVGNSQTHTSTTFLDVMKTGRPTLTGLECIIMTSEVAEGLHEMHTRGLLHNDVAARNILICHNGTRFKAKLTDFGMVSSIQEPRRSEKKTFKSEVERDHYISTHPEIAIERILHGASDSVQTDIYSLGYGIKVLGTAIGNIDMSALGDACIRVNADDRPPLDYVISTLDPLADNERVTPVCRSIDIPLF